MGWARKGLACAARHAPRSLARARWTAEGTNVPSHLSSIAFRHPIGDALHGMAGSQRSRMRHGGERLTDDVRRRSAMGIVRGCVGCRPRPSGRAMTLTRESDGGGAALRNAYAPYREQRAAVTINAGLPASGLTGTLVSAIGGIGVLGVVAGTWRVRSSALGTARAGCSVWYGKCSVCHVSRRMLNVSNYFQVHSQVSNASSTQDARSACDDSMCVCGRAALSWLLSIFEARRQDTRC